MRDMYKPGREWAAVVVLSHVSKCRRHRAPIDPPPVSRLLLCCCCSSASPSSTCHPLPSPLSSATSVSLFSPPPHDPTLPPLLAAVLVMAAAHPPPEGTHKVRPTALLARQDQNNLSVSIMGLHLLTLLFLILLLIAVLEARHVHVVPALPPLRLAVEIHLRPAQADGLVTPLAGP